MAISGINYSRRTWSSRKINSKTMSRGVTTNSASTSTTKKTTTLTHRSKMEAKANRCPRSLSQWVRADHARMAAEGDCTTTWVCPVCRDHQGISKLRLQEARYQRCSANSTFWTESTCWNCCPRSASRKNLKLTIYNMNEATQGTSRTAGPTRRRSTLRSLSTSRSTTSSSPRTQCSARLIQSVGSCAKLKYRRHKWHR